MYLLSLTEAKIAIVAVIISQILALDQPLLNTDLIAVIVLVRGHTAIL